jgi:hypothetical protein
MFAKRVTTFLTLLLVVLLLPAADALNGDESKAWSIVASYPIIESASGLAYDGTYLYCGIYGTNGGQVYQIDPSNGGYSLLFTGPQEDAYGMTYDGTNIWVTDHPGSSSSPAKAMKLDWDGTLLKEFNLPTHYMSGIAYDNGNFWVSAYYPDPSQIYKVDTLGTILKQFTAPDNQPWDLCLQDGYLWMADYWGDALYKIDTATGALLETHASESNDAAGIVWDGAFLWYCDNGTGGNDYLYKIDLSGSGTPVLYVPVDEHDYGTVTVGESDTWLCSAENIGTADLQLDSVTFTGSGDFSCTDAFPIVVGTTSQVQLHLVFAPTSSGALSATATIHSTDPVHPGTNVLLSGNGAFPGPDINVVDNSFDYGTVRTGAFTRWFMEIENLGDDVLTINAISPDDIHFSIDNSVTYPFDIPVLGSVLVGVWFNPEFDMAYSANIPIYSNDADENPYVVTVEGMGILKDWLIGDTLWTDLITTGYDNSPKAMIPIPDITGDGVDDVIIATEDDYVRCFNGNAHGHGDIIWEHEIYAGSVYKQDGLAIIEDIDEDDYPDVVVASAWGGQLIRCISGKTGDEIWTHYTDEYGDGGWVYSVDCSYDYNNDGTTDVLATAGDDANDTGPKRVYCLNGLSGISIWEFFTGGPSFVAIGVEDFTGDGHPDAVVGCSNNEETNGVVYGLNGVDGSNEWGFATPGSSVWGLTQIDDFTGDGVKDIAIGDFTGGNVFWLDATNGDDLHVQGGFGLVTGLITLDDVNGDGHPDIVPAHSGNSANVLDGYAGGFVWQTPIADHSSMIAKGNDVSGDGINDLFLGTMFTNNYCYFLDGTDGEVLYSVAFPSPVDAITAIPDIVGDNSWEMVAGGRNGQLYCFSGGINSVENNAPSVPTIDGASSGNIGTEYTFDFLSVDPEGHDVYYLVAWGDEAKQDWVGPYPSDTKVQLAHTYTSAGDFEIIAKAKDIYNMQSDWSEIYLFSVNVICGDVNDDLFVNVSDAVAIINYVFVGGDAPDPLCEGDADGSTEVNVSDAVRIINYVFVDGAPPVETCCDK